ncbi:MAG TPA: S8 family peptidase [Pseudobdellovibrionaceae bacterium]|jgi:subtilisin family serine protease
MDVGIRSLSRVLVLLFLISACSPKTTTSVFDEKNYGSSACSGQALNTRYVVQWENGQFTVESATDVEKFKKDFLEPNLDKIRKVEYDRVLQLKKRTDVVSAASVDTDAEWGQNIVQVSTLWNQGIYGQNVLVGIVDSTVDINNVQLSGNIAYNTGEIPGNGLDDDENGYVDDYAGYNFISSPNNSKVVSDHGTHVSGIIAADQTKGSIKGIAPHAKIIPAPFIDGANGGSIGDAILALQYVSTRGAKVINASWGGAPCMLSLQNAFAELNKKGILIVVAAGNEGADIDYIPDYPAAFNMPNQLTVAASTSYDFMASWSNVGFTLVHLAAPGNDILSTITGNRTSFMSGTSMAAPFVTGAAALLWSHRPQATVSDIKTALLRSVDVTPNHEFKVQTMGRMNVKKALEELNKLLP